MTLGNPLSGYLSALKRKDKKGYDKWMRMVQSSGKSVTQRPEELMRADLKYGIEPLDDRLSGKAAEKAEVRKLEDNISIAGAINRLVEAMTVNNIQVVQNQQAQLTKLGIEPLQAEISELNQAREQNRQAIEQQQQMFEDILSKKKAQERLLKEQEERMKDMQAEYSAMLTKLQETRIKAATSAASHSNDVSAGAEDNATVPQKRDTKGRFSFRGKGRGAEAPGDAEG